MQIRSLVSCAGATTELVVHRDRFCINSDTASWPSKNAQIHQRAVVEIFCRILKCLKCPKCPIGKNVQY